GMSSSPRAPPSCAARRSSATGPTSTPPSIRSWPPSRTVRSPPPRPPPASPPSSPPSSKKAPPASSSVGTTSADQALAKREVRGVLEYRGRVYIFDNVPAELCAQCGETPLRLAAAKKVEA